MTWFKVDDGMHCHPKVRKVLAQNPAAIALWTVAGSWSGDNLTEGFIPNDQLPWLMPADAEQLALTLCAAGLWRRTRGGFVFHQWLTNGDGTKRNPSKTEVEEERRKKAEAGRKGGLASAKARSKRLARAEAPASQSVQPPTRPSSSTKKRGSDDAPLRGRASPPRCGHCGNTLDSPYHRNTCNITDIHATA